MYNNWYLKRLFPQYVYGFINYGQSYIKTTVLVVVSISQCNKIFYLITLVFIRAYIFNYVNHSDNA